MKIAGRRGAVGRGVLLAWSIGLLLMGRSAPGQANQPPAHYKYFPAVLHEEFGEFEKRHGKLVEMWAALNDEQLEMRRLEKVFGTTARREAQRALVGLGRSVDKAQPVFRRDFDKVRDGYQSERDKLKRRQLDMEDKVDWDKADTPAFEVVRARLAEMNTQLSKYDRILKICDLMVAQLAASSGTSRHGRGSPNSFRVDPQLYGSMEKEYAPIIELGMTVLDHHADIAEIQATIKEKGESAATTRALQMAERGLQAARGNLTAAVERAKSSFDREVDRSKRQVEQLNARIAAKEGRKSRPNKELEEKAAIEKRLEEIGERLKFLDGIVTGCEPRAPAKK